MRLYRRTNSTINSRKQQIVCIVFFAAGALPGAFRTEGPLCLNSGEEPLQHEAGAEELSAPVLTQGGSGPVGGTSAGHEARGAKAVRRAV
jgi:hypothetical protein